MCRVAGEGRRSEADYDHIVEADSLPRPRSGDTWTRERGYAVKVTDDDWLFFANLAAAYTFGRAGHMSARSTSWSVREAVDEIKFDELTGREVRTLHLLFGADHANRSAASDRELLISFVAGASDGPASPLFS